jgi:hypothetical protein
MITREAQAGIGMNLDHCIAFCGGILGNPNSTNNERVLAALTITIASIGSAYIQDLEVSLISKAGRN